MSEKELSKEETEKEAASFRETQREVDLRHELVTKIMDPVRDCMRIMEGQITRFLDNGIRSAVLSERQRCKAEEANTVHLFLETLRLDLKEGGEKRPLHWGHLRTEVKRHWGI
jgi:hypothetical protein